MVMKEIIYGKEYYNEIIDTRLCGSEKFERINFSLSNLSQEALSHRWICHVNADKFALALENNKSVIATTGIGLTGIPHVGNIAQIVNAIILQRAGIPVQIVLGDLDAYCGKAKDLKYTQELIQKYRRYIRNLGFKEDGSSIVRTQSEALSVLKTLYLTGYYLDDQILELAKEDIHDYYSYHNKIDSGMSYRIKLSLNLMVADFMDLHINHGYENVIVFLGIDEYKYVGLAMDVLNRAKANGYYNDFNLMGIFSKTMPGLNGYSKMGKSFPESGITPLTNREKVIKYIYSQNENEIDVEDNVIFQMISSVSFYDQKKVEKAKLSYINKDGSWLNVKTLYLPDLFNILDKWGK